MIATTLLVAQLAASCGLADSAQLVIVVTEGWNASTADLSTFDKGPDGAWRPQIKREPIFVGRSGLGWGDGVVALTGAGPKKREGDRRSPAGVFRLGAAFGTGLPTATAIALPREPVDERICVDDPKSRVYAQRIRREEAKRDWKSAEELASYNQAIVVEHNVTRVRGAGSCIFLHDGAAPTPGCSASPSWLMEKLLAWLRPTACPLLVQLPRKEYVARAAALGLPALPDADKPVCEQAAQPRH